MGREADCFVKSPEGAPRTTLAAASPRCGKWPGEPSSLLWTPTLSDGTWEPRHGHLRPASTYDVARASLSPRESPSRLIARPSRRRTLGQSRTNRARTAHGAAQESLARAKKVPFSWSNHWHPQRDSNPCFRLERAMSSAAGRWGLDPKAEGTKRRAKLSGAGLRSGGAFARK